MKAAAVALAMIMLVPSVLAVDGQEDFENYPQSWYSLDVLFSDPPPPEQFFLDNPCGDIDSEPSIVTSGFISGTCLRWGPSAGNTVKMSFNLVKITQPTFLEFAIRETDLTGGMSGCAGNREDLSSSSFCISPVGAESGLIFHFTGKDESADCAYRFRDVAGISIALLHKTAKGADCSILVRVEFDWTNKTYRGEVNDSGVYTAWLPFLDPTVEFVESWQMTSLTSTRVWFDNFQVDGVGIVVPPETAEFDSGLLTFITGLGFITPESQFFFSIILVGIATVSGGVALKFMAPSRMKLVIVLLVAALVGAFCAILQLFDLWMFLLAIVIGGTVVKGSTEFRNTWREIRETIAQRGRLVDESGQIVGEPAQPQDDFSRLVREDQARERATQARETGQEATTAAPADSEAI